MRGTKAEPRLLEPWFALAVVLSACATPLPEKRNGTDRDAGSTGGGAIGPATLRFDPPATADAITPITRVMVDFAQALSQPRVVLLSGALTTSQLREVARPVLPQTLSDRSVSALAWTEADPAGLVVAPLVTLELGALYTIGVSAPPTALPFTVGAVDASETLLRVWPDREDAAPSARAAVWCGTRELELSDTPLALDPAGIDGHFAVGTGAPIAAKRCVSWFARDEPAEADSGASPAVAPASLVLSNGSRVLLEPTLLWDRQVSAARETSACDAPRTPFGPGCAEVQDDRVIVRPPIEPILWTIEGEHGAVVRATRDAKRFVVRPMPLGAIFDVATLDRSGSASYCEVTVTPAAPRAHLVINEVMANPAGDEPSEEWIEIYNDGTQATSLGGYSVEDLGGHAVLPDVILAASAFALVVSESFVEDDGVDPRPAEGTLIVRVPVLGKSGLSNEGESIVLRSPGGDVVSMFPAVKTKNGVSVARIAVDALDEDAASFEMSRNGKGTPGGGNGGK